MMVFTEKKFENSLTNSNSIHSIDVVTEFELKRAIKKNEWEHAMDFKCNTCEKPIRLIYMPNEFRMGSPYYQLKTVVERES